MLTETLPCRPHSAHALPHRSTTAILALCLVIIGIFQCLTIREGHEWGDDFAMYIMHAKNLAEGKPYGATGYIYNPENPNIGPRVYPPFTPLFLMPIYKFSGLSIGGMKVEMAMWLLLALIAVFKIARQYLAFEWALGLVLIIGFSPVFSNAKEMISSDLPFLFVVLTFLYAANRHMSKASSMVHGSLGIGALIYVAYATRSVALILIPTLLCYGLLRKKAVPALIASGFSAVLILIQGFVLPQGETSILKLFDHSPATIFERFIDYSWRFHGYWMNGYSNKAAAVLFFASLLLCGLGVRAALKRPISIYDIFVIFYLVLISAYTDDAPRYLFPVVPFYMLHILVGFTELRHLLPRLYTPAIVLGSIVIALSYSGRYMGQEWGPHVGGLSDRQYLAMCQFIVDNTGIDEKIISLKPRLLALVTAHAASANGKIATLPAYMTSIGAHFIVTGEVQRDNTLQRFCSEHSDLFELVYKTGPYALYRYRPV